MDLQITKTPPAAPVTVWLRQEQRRKLAELQRRSGLSASCLVRAAVDALGDVIVLNGIDDLEGGENE